MAINSINTVTLCRSSIYTDNNKISRKRHPRQRKRQLLPRQLPVSFMRRVLTPGQTRLPIKQQARPTTQRLLQKLKADAEQRTAQLRSIVEQMMTKQGVAIGTADDMWKFLAKGDFTVSADVAQAQADIADDGYWGVEQTSDRILDFAKSFIR